MEVILKKEVILNKTACRMIGAGVFAVLTVLGAFVRIPLPFTPVPLTLQTMFVLLAGAFLGGRLAAVSQLAYILLGICGLPVFTGAGSGWLYAMGPTGGYLIGFILAVFFLGKFIRPSGTNPLAIFALFCASDLILLMSGAVWLKLLFGLTFAKALFLGVLPFAAGDMVKALAATSIYLSLRNRASQVF